MLPNPSIFGWRVCGAAITALLVLLALLAISHARPLAPPSCFDELEMRWNGFVADANAHIQTMHAKDASKAHEKLDREWEGLRALACW